MLTNNSLIKKGEFYIHQKRFSERFFLTPMEKNIDPDLLKISKSGTSNILNIKTSFYALSKLLKEQKRKTMDLTNHSSLVTLDKLSFKFQTSGLYTSLVEQQKRKKLAELRGKITEFYVLCLLKHYKRSFTALDSKDLTRGFFDKKAYKVFYKKLKKSKFSITCKPRRKKNLQSLAILQKRYTRIFHHRLSLFLNSNKIKYKKVLAYNRLKMKQVFNLFSRTRMNFIKDKKDFKKEYKELVWKRKKKRNRKKTGLLFFLRRRRRILHKYYVPRHLEINYKTFDVAHLGEFDLPTTNSRITFWLNLRRLLTFLSL